jgi:8-oxo-dGTP pyrophosphatase MutT (NUDIX family)
VRQWTVGGALIVRDDALLLVRNRRRDGSHDWTPPGGVIESTEELLDGLAREVLEETGLVVEAWAGCRYTVRIDAPGLGWQLSVQAWEASVVSGELVIDDPDGIVVQAHYALPHELADHLATVHPWVREPVTEWATERWDVAREYHFEVAGSDRAALVVTRR